MDLRISLACDRYDRTDALRTGEVRPEGIDLQFLTMTPTEAFWRLTQGHEFDVSEMSLSGFIMRVARGDDSYIGLPIFTSRVFRHGDIFVREDADPTELAGTRIAMPEYHMTAALFMRGLLHDEFGLAAEDVTWVQAGHHRPGRVEREPLDVAPIRVEIDRQRTIDQLLCSGDVVAALNPYGSTLLNQPKPVVRRLYEDPIAAGTEYFGRTGVYPIMHLVVMRGSIYEQAPWTALELCKAFERAKDLALSRISGIGGHSPVALPFFVDRVAEARALFGEDLWPYGLESNRPTLEAACRYSFEQGLSRRLVAPEELFAEVTLRPRHID